jgi:hypothetical protein
MPTEPVCSSTTLKVTEGATLSLSAETVGWMQQDSMEDGSIVPSLESSELHEDHSKQSLNLQPPRGKIHCGIYQIKIPRLHWRQILVTYGTDYPLDVED